MSAGRYYGLGRELLPGVAGRAARWQRRAAKEAAQPGLGQCGETETTIVNIEQLSQQPVAAPGPGPRQTSHHQHLSSEQRREPVTIPGTGHLRAHQATSEALVTWGAGWEVPV